MGWVAVLRSGERWEFPYGEYTVVPEEFNFAPGHPPINHTPCHPHTTKVYTQVALALIVECKVIIPSPINTAVPPYTLCYCIRREKRQKLRPVLRLPTAYLLKYNENHIQTLCQGHITTI